MMLHDDYAADIARDHALLAAHLINRYHTARLHGAQIGPATIHAFRLDALGLLTAFNLTATQKTLDHLTGISVGSLTKPADAYLRTLAVVVAGHVNDLVTKLMGARNDRIANLLNHDAGAVGLLIGKQAEQITLTAKMGGRTWPADKVVPVLAREFAYNAFIDQQLANIGTDMVEIVYPDSTHVYHGVKLHLHEIGAFRRAIFHPNSQAEVRPYVHA